MKIYPIERVRNTRRDRDNGRRIFKRSQIWKTPSYNSIVMRSKTRTVRRILAYHDLRYKTIPLKSEGETHLMRIGDKC